MIDLEKLSKEFEKVFYEIKKDDKILILTHVDSDGVSSGAILYKILNSLNFKNFNIIFPNKGENGYSESVKKRIKDANPSILFILDLGSYKTDFDNIKKIILIDHHKPEGVPVQGVLFSSFPPPPYISSSYLAFLLFHYMNLNPKDYIGLIGEVGDYGTDTDAPLIKELFKKYKKKEISYISSLINSARRVKEFNIDLSFKYLIESESLLDLLSNSDYKKKLEEYKEIIKKDIDNWKRVKPKFIKQIAIIEINSENLIHPIIAQIWKNILDKYIVICANFGYIENKVSFSMRTSLNISLLEFLRNFLEPSIEEDLGFGHERATGGIVSIDKWNEFISKISNSNFGVNL
ncbi:MAG: DHH family phosphoesterase [Caldisericia bacterium]|nr:DHH family phosphoesterase [Caldisericia bacterium]